MPYGHASDCATDGIVCVCVCVCVHVCLCVRALACRAEEKLVRSLLTLPKRPAVVFVHPISWWAKVSMQEAAVARGNTWHAPTCLLVQPSRTSACSNACVRGFSSLTI